jgi:hypothetical protein
MGIEGPGYERCRGATELDGELISEVLMGMPMSLDRSSNREIKPSLPLDTKRMDSSKV